MSSTSEIVKAVPLLRVDSSIKMMDCAVIHFIAIGYPTAIAMTFDCSIRIRERREIGSSVFSATRD